MAPPNPRQLMHTTARNTNTSTNTRQDAQGMGSCGIKVRQPQVHTLPKRTLSGALLLVDLDSTALTSEESPPGSHSYLLTAVRRGLLESVDLVRADGGARCCITSAAAEYYVDGMLKVAGAANRLDGRFSRNTMDVKFVECDGRLIAGPKDYRKVISATGQFDPLANCVVFGDDKDSDVPSAPLGMVTIIAPFNVPFQRLLLYATSLRFHGNGNFAKGFDLGFNSHLAGQDFTLVRDQGWKFIDGRTGLARVVCIGMDPKELLPRLSEDAKLRIANDEVCKAQLDRRINAEGRHTDGMGNVGGRNHGQERQVVMVDRKMSPASIGPRFCQQVSTRPQPQKLTGLTGA